jgi:hypothetical protein
MAVSRHTWLRRYARAISLIPLYVALVSQSLLRIHGHVGHVVVGHMRVLRHARSVALRREVLVRGFFWRLDLVAAIDAILIAWSGLRSIKTSLVMISPWSVEGQNLSCQADK